MKRTRQSVAQQNVAPAAAAAAAATVLDERQEFIER